MRIKMEAVWLNVEFNLSVCYANISHADIFPQWKVSLFLCASFSFYILQKMLLFDGCMFWVDAFFTSFWIFLLFFGAALISS